MADRFVQALHMTLRHEGGISDHPDDPVDVTFEAGSRARPGGRSQFGPWRLGVAQDKLGETEAFSYHDCGGWRWWLTKPPLFRGG